MSRWFHFSSERDQPAEPTSEQPSARGASSSPRVRRMNHRSDPILRPAAHPDACGGEREESIES
jgi:hypothetical protein